MSISAQKAHRANNSNEEENPFSEAMKEINVCGM